MPVSPTFPYLCTNIIVRKIIVNLAVSLDGFIEGPNGEYDWCIMEPELDFQAFLDSVDTVLFGRKSFEVFSKELDKATSAEAIDVAMNTIDKKHKTVFSRSRKDIEGADEVISNDIIYYIKQLKRSEGKDIWFFGGSDLLTQFIKEGLIDEYQLALHPTVLGQGTSLFKNITKRINLKLKKTESFPSGLVMLTYEPS